MTWHLYRLIFTFSQCTTLRKHTRLSDSLERALSGREMPRVKQKASVTLKSLCVRSICDNIDQIWSREFLQNYYGKAHYIFIIGRRKTVLCQYYDSILYFFSSRSLWPAPPKSNSWCVGHSEGEEAVEEASLLFVDISLLEDSQFVWLWRESWSNLTTDTTKMLQSAGVGLISQQASQGNNSEVSSSSDQPPISVLLLLICNQ